MMPTLPILLLCATALLSYTTERSLSRFTWSHLEALDLPRQRRQRVANCLRERGMVTTTFLVVGSLAVSGMSLLIVHASETAFAGAWIVLLAVLLIWIAPEVMAWRFGEAVVVYLVPAVYPLVGAPFRALRAAFRFAARAGAREATTSGLEANAALSDDEAHEVFRMAVRLRHVPVREIMTPRTEIVGIPETATLCEAARIGLETGYSRLPVYRSNSDHVIGILHLKDLLKLAGSEKWEKPALAELIRQPFCVPETKPASELLRELQRLHVHMGIVLDEYGGTLGLVTIEDIIEELIGEIGDEYEAPHEATPYKWLDARTVEVEAATRVAEFNEKFGADLPEHEDFDTIGGFAMFALGRIPLKGESFRFAGGTVTVLEADPRRVIRVRIAFDRDLRRAGEK